MAARLVRSVYDQIKSRIQLSGPIPVADYMKMALTQSRFELPADMSQGRAGQEFQGGYYMRKDVFGPRGDFITSPEISQMFGEMIGVWGIQTWLQIGGPKKFNIVELGPGRGTLAKDVLRVFKKFEYLVGSDVALHLVEISPYMANLQEETLCGKKKNYFEYWNKSSSSSSASHDDNWVDPQKQLPEGQSFYRKATCKQTQYPIFWYRDIHSLPQEFNLYVAHEFFDALPVHKLQRSSDQEWREILVDVDPSDTEKLRYVLARNETPVIKILKNYHEKLLHDHRNHLEVSVDTIMIVDEMTKRIDRDGGIGLIIDYGHDGTKEDTFRGFYKHQLHDPLVQPGMADLTADVDFSLIKKLWKDKCWVCGPTAQRQFLKSVGIEVRYRRLLESCKTEDEKKVLQSGYNMLMEDMGERFKFMGIFPKVLQDYSPALKIIGFDD